jgi:hypothetical protein
MKNTISDLELITEVYNYFEDDELPFSYTIAGMLDSKIDVSSDWSSLRDAYINGEFTPANVIFMISYMEHSNVSNIERDKRNLEIKELEERLAVLKSEQ